MLESTAQHHCAADQNTVSNSANRVRLLTLAQQHYQPGVVRIDDKSIEKIAWSCAAVQPMRITLRGTKAIVPSDAMAFLVVLCALNYRFWSRTEAGVVMQYRHAELSGSRALWSSLEDAWSSRDPSWRTLERRLQSEGVQALFGDIPDGPSRLAILNEILCPRLDQVTSDLTASIMGTSQVTIDHAAQLADAFPLAFGDPYLKKAQLALSMFSAYCNWLNLNIAVDQLTAFADYQVPRVLRAIGVLSYSDALTEALDQRQWIDAGSDQEHAIRGATILACERIAARIGSTAAAVDNLLWQSQSTAVDAPFHLTPTTWY